MLTHFWRNTWDERKAESLRATGDFNANALAETYSLGLADVIDHVAQLSEALYCRVWPTVPSTAEFPHHYGRRISLPAKQANSLRELLLHGWDIANAADLDWPIHAEEVAATAPLGELFSAFAPQPLAGRRPSPWRSAATLWAGTT